MLRAENLRKAFGSLQVVDDLDFQVARGEVFGLLGPNGAGKSTTMAMLMGLILPDSGQVTIDEVGDPSSQLARSRLGYAPQHLSETGPLRFSSPVWDAPESCS